MFIFRFYKWLFDEVIDYYVADAIGGLLGPLLSLLLAGASIIIPIILIIKLIKWLVNRHRAVVENSPARIKQREEWEQKQERAETNKAEEIKRIIKIYIKEKQITKIQIAEDGLVVYYMDSGEKRVGIKLDLDRKNFSESGVMWKLIRVYPLNGFHYKEFYSTETRGTGEYKLSYVKDPFFFSGNEDHLEISQISEDVRVRKAWIVPY